MVTKKTDCELVERSYVKLRDVINPNHFRFWNRGTWSSGKRLFSDAKTKRVEGGNHRIFTNNCKTKRVETKIAGNYTKTITVKCKSGKVDENNWMSPKRSF